MFWKELGTSCNFANDSFGYLHRILSISRTLRSEMLELPSPATSSSADQALLVNMKKRRGNNLKKKVCVKAEDLIFKQPTSILHLAVHSMFSYDPKRAIGTSMSVQTAARRFAIPLREVRLLIKDAEKDETARGHEVAQNFRRIDVLTVLEVAMNKKGGLKRIANAIATRNKNKMRTMGKLITLARQEIDDWFKPMIDKTQPLVEDKKKISKKRLTDNFKALKRSMVHLQMFCRYSGPDAPVSRIDISTKYMAERISTAKRHARRLQAAYNRIMNRDKAQLAVRLTGAPMEL